MGLAFALSAIISFCFHAFAYASLSPHRDPVDLTSRYEMKIEDSYLTMPDGVKIAVSYYIPMKSALANGASKDQGIDQAMGIATPPIASAEKFPTLFEMIPYRKDDSFYGRDYSLYSYFVERGFLVVKADVRGTGSSYGTVPDREYSDIELSDAREIISQIAKHPLSNGKVGMFGISWGGFNSIMTAMNPPVELKAILAAHGSDDLFHDDVHWIDGLFHVDEYEMSIDLENALPRSPDYRVDAEYLQDRFYQMPWIFLYKSHPHQSEFWTRKSLRSQYHQLQRPAYLIGGLLDGYRDSVPRMFQNVLVPVLARIGPWNHAWPDNGEPAPNYEWRAEAIRWWRHWLADDDTGILNEPRFVVFVRDSQAPDKEPKLTKGEWAFFRNWPPAGSNSPSSRALSSIPNFQFKLGSNGGLLPSNRIYPNQEFAPVSFRSHRGDPLVGTELGFWWGEVTGDIQAADAKALKFESDPLANKQILIGSSKLRLRVRVNQPRAYFIVRISDVFPDGTSTFVTGGARNGEHRFSASNPEPLVPGEWTDIEVPLRFTTWTFNPGHRIRVSIDNYQFPMFFSPLGVEMDVATADDFRAVDHPVGSDSGISAMVSTPSSSSSISIPLIEESDLASFISPAGQRPWPFDLPIEERKNREGFSEGEGEDQIEILRESSNRLSVRWTMKSDYSIRRESAKVTEASRAIKSTTKSARLDTFSLHRQMIWAVDTSMGYEFSSEGSYRFPNGTQGDSLGRPQLLMHVNLSLISDGTEIKCRTFRELKDAIGLATEPVIFEKWFPY